MNSRNASTQGGPAWRQFWFWFVLAPPLAAVVMGLTLVYTAVTRGDDKVVDNYYQAGRAIHKDFALEQRAEELQLEARIAIDREDGTLTVHLQGDTPLPRQLHLSLSHATDADRDRSVTLKADDSGLYRGRVDGPVSGRHYLRLEPMEGDWRLSSELAVRQALVEIAPAGQHD